MNNLKLIITFLFVLAVLLNSQFVISSEMDSDLNFSTYFGGKGTDDCDVVTVDLQGNAYLGCHATSGELFKNSEHGYSRWDGMDAFVAKVNQYESTVAFLTHLGGDEWEGVQGIVVDKNGNTYAVGTTYSDNFQVTSDAAQSEFGGKSDAFLAKLNAVGDIEWSTFFGGNGDEDGRAIALDLQGNIHIVGRTQSTNLATTHDAIQSTNRGKTDIFVASFSQDGKLLYSTYYGGSHDDIGFSLAVTDDDRLIVTGRTTSTDLPVKNGLFDCNMGGEDAFVLSLKKAGREVEFATYIGGSSNDRAQGVVVDSSKNIFVLGSTESADLLESSQSKGSAFGGKVDGFFLKLNSTGEQIEFMRFFGGSEMERPRYLALDHEGHAVIVGHSKSADFDKNTAGGRLDQDNGFIVKIDTSSSKFTKSKMIGGNGDDAFEGLAINPDGSLTVSGASNSTDFITVKPLQSDFRGGRYDIILFNIDF